MKEKKLVLAIIAIIALIIIGANSVFATSGNIVVIQGNNAANNVNNVNEVNQVNQVNQVNAVNSINKVNNVAANTSKYNNTTPLPKTGANDYAVLFIIAICGVSAVYAYKKIRDYNI